MTAHRPAFEFGVASGDPVDDSVLLWTAVDHPDGPIVWQVATDAEFESIVSHGEVSADPSTPTVHVRVEGLAPGTRYRYRFGVDHDGREWSAVGSTSTTPISTDRVRIGLASCGRLPTSTFDPYRHLAERDLDLIVHLGDYIYEDASSGHIPSHRCLTIDDYVARYRQYRRDPALQTFHASAPWVSVWDDHDVADDAWRHGGPADLDDVPVDWVERHAAAQRALFDWMPQKPSSTGPTPMDRRIRHGDLVDIVLVDARHAGRSKPVSLSGPALVRPDDDRPILTDDQWTWLATCVDDAAATGRWLVLCTPMQASPLHLARLPDVRRRFRTTPLVNPGQWDGYPVEQRRLAEVLQPAAGRALICSGDLHGRFVSSLDLDGGHAIPEITVPSIASTPFADTIGASLPVPVPAGLLARWLARLNPHVSAMNLTDHGSSWLDVTPERIEVVAVEADGNDGSTWRIERGDDHLRCVTVGA